MFESVCNVASCMLHKHSGNIEFLTSMLCCLWVTWNDLYCCNTRHVVSQHVLTPLQLCSPLSLMKRAKSAICPCVHCLHGGQHTIASIHMVCNLATYVAWQPEILLDTHLFSVLLAWHRLKFRGSHDASTWMIVYSMGPPMCDSSWNMYRKNLITLHAACGLCAS